MANTTKKYTFRCKPCYKFQSIEFEVKGNKEDIPEILELYELILSDLIEISPDQETAVKQAKKAEKQAIPASEKQIAILKRFKIPFNEDISMKEAQLLIKESFERSKAE